MKNRSYFTLFFAMLFVLMTVNLKAQTDNANADGFNGGYGQVYQSFGVAQATVNMQNNTQMQIQKAILQIAAKRNSGSRPKSNSSKSVAFFTPISTSENFKIIADTVGQDAEQRTLFKQLFVETKKGFDAEMTQQGRKNNLAAAMTFFIATTVTIYNDDPEPSEEATENLFQALSAMYDETPEMTNVPNKDKQFLHDTFVAFSGMPLAFYTEAKEKNDEEMLKLAKVVAGALLLEILKINPNDVRFESNILKFKNAQNTNQTSVQQSSVKPGITKYATTFDDGWVATALNDYVQLQKSGTEMRLFYVNKEWDDSRLNTVEPTDHYWAKTVSPYFNVSNVQRWSGVEYPVIYFLQADAVDKKTGKQSFITMKIIYEGGARVVVTIAPNKTAYQQQFPHPNDLNKMLNANRFAVTAQDLNGTWSGGGGGGVEYYSVYGYEGMSAISTSDEFIFSSNGSYQSTHDSANMSGSGTRFAKLQYKGKFTVSDWELLATNRVSGKTKKFFCQFEAVRGGFLLKLTDSDYEPLKYTLFKKR
jgi:hypothetical protein